MFQVKEGKADRQLSQTLSSMRSTLNLKSQNM